MIYETAAPPDVMEMLKASLQLEDDRASARASIHQEIRDRDDAQIILLRARRLADNSPRYDYLTRAIAKLEQHVDALFTVLEVL